MKSDPIAARSRDLTTARWQRLHLQVRCALKAEEPARIRRYLHTGLQLVRSGTRPAVPVHMRMLQMLLRTAQYEALPSFWRSACLEHVNLPLAQLASHLGLHDPLVMQAIECAVQRARDQRPDSPSRMA